MLRVCTGRCIDEHVSLHSVRPNRSYQASGDLECASSSFAHDVMLVLQQHSYAGLAGSRPIVSIHALWCYLRRTLSEIHFRRRRTCFCMRTPVFILSRVSAGARTTTPPFTSPVTMSLPLPAMHVMASVWQTSPPRMSCLAVKGGM